MENKVFIGSDLHISDRYSGRHVNYLQNCFNILQMYTDEIEKNKVTHIILTGDLVGLREKTLKTREMLLYMMQVLQKWNTMTNGNVYSISGNHDFGSALTDFEVFVSMGLVKKLVQLDVGSVRFHGLDFGYLNRAINVDPDKYNIAITHDDIQVEGITTWYRGGGKGTELSSLTNLKGVELVVAGHIHEPSPRMVSTSIEDEEISLFYTGCPTRPKKDNLWDKSFAILVNTDENDVSLGQVTFNLTPANELFKDTYDDSDDEVGDLIDDNPMVNIEELSKILSELQTYNIGGGGDYKSQIMRVAGIDKEAAELALSYVEKVEMELK